ncbi:hypothetical protein [Antrihabitans spumae]|uniref:DUF4190 domain-containing protein n=1 Tax=Antrihabitans spumae TaxID=3373370 RepID=A0ABW7JY72_9NOCA
MDTFLKTVDSLWRVVAIGLVFGAGLPVVFAYGIKFLAVNEINADGTVGRRNPVMAFAGSALLALVLLSVIAGVLFIAKDFILTSFDISLFGAKAKG